MPYTGRFGSGSAASHDRTKRRRENHKQRIHEAKANASRSSWVGHSRTGKFHMIAFDVNMPDPSAARAGQTLHVRVMNKQARVSDLKDLVVTEAKRHGMLVRRPMWLMHRGSEVGLGNDSTRLDECDSLAIDDIDFGASASGAPIRISAFFGQKPDRASAVGRAVFNEAMA